MRARRHVEAIALAALLASLTGCFTVEARLDRNGAASMWLTYFVPRHATQESERARLSSPHVRVGTFREVQRFVRVDLAVDDVTRLATAPAFDGVAVTRTPSDGAERLDIRVPAPDSKQRALIQGALAVNPGSKGPRITLTLPGRVLDASPGIHVRGNRMKWYMSLAAYRDAASTALWVRYSM
jgi:hypothetical protein